MHINDLEACGKKCCYFWFHSEEQDKSTDVKQQPPFGDCNWSNTLLRIKRGGGVQNQQEHHMSLTK